VWDSAGSNTVHGYLFLASIPTGDILVLSTHADPYCPVLVKCISAASLHTALSEVDPRVVNNSVIPAYVHPLSDRALIVQYSIRRDSITNPFEMKSGLSYPPPPLVVVLDRDLLTPVRLVDILPSPSSSRLASSLTSKADSPSPAAAKERLLLAQFCSHFRTPSQKNVEPDGSNNGVSTQVIECGPLSVLLSHTVWEQHAHTKQPEPVVSYLVSYEWPSARVLGCSKLPDVVDGVTRFLSPFENAGYLLSRNHVMYFEFACPTHTLSLIERPKVGDKPIESFVIRSDQAFADALALRSKQTGFEAQALPLPDVEFEISSIDISKNGTRLLIVDEYVFVSSSLTRILTNICFFTCSGASLYVADISRSRIKPESRAVLSSHVRKFGVSYVSLTR
jgi:hypothetical protein